MFNELVNEIISLIESRESRERSRTEKERTQWAERSDLWFKTVNSLGYRFL